VLLSIPVDEGSLGDLEPLGNAAQAPSFGAEFEELVFGVGIIHNSIRFRTRLLLLRA
jgi:hypothetical protein